MGFLIQIARACVRAWVTFCGEFSTVSYIQKTLTILKYNAQSAKYYYSMGVTYNNSVVKTVTQ